MAYVYLEKEARYDKMGQIKVAQRRGGHMMVVVTLTLIFVFLGYFEVSYFFNGNIFFIAVCKVLRIQAYFLYLSH